jgi:pimeloyl-ACP methyl ester carboxylesterase
MKSVATVLLFLSLTGCASASEPASSSEEPLGGATPLGPDPAGSATRYPILLAHGFLGSSDGFASFNPRITDALVADGHAVQRGSVPPFASVKTRAAYLAHDVDALLAQTGSERSTSSRTRWGGSTRASW